MMRNAGKLTIATAAIGLAALSLSSPAKAGSSDIGAGLVGFGIGAILGSMMGPPEVYFVPPPPVYYGPAVYGPPDYDGPVVYGPVPRPPRAYGGLAYPRVKTPPRSAVHERRPEPPRSQTARTGAPTSAVVPNRAKAAKTGTTIGTDPQRSDARFKAAQAKAKRSGVHTLTQKDIEGLSAAQIKQIRGY
jgi:hypothetical protein